jgi:single-strand DNA-binding protein
MIKVNVIGNLGKNPEAVTLNTRNGEKEKVSLRLAVSVGSKEQPLTVWFEVSTWGKLAERCKEQLAQGDRVFVTGSMRAREFTRDGANRPELAYMIEADSVTSLMARERTEGNSAAFPGTQRETGPNASDKQIALIGKLLFEKGVPISDHSDMVESITGFPLNSLSVGFARGLIDKIKSNQIPALNGSAQAASRADDSFMDDDIPF